jgi:AcrR family transcriptional regulator
VARPLTPTSRQRIVDAAQELFTRQGIEGTTLEEIAQAAGVHRATLHRTFPGGRDELVAEVVLATGLDTVARSRHLMADAPSVVDGLVDLFTELVLVGRKDPVVRQSVSLISDDFASGGERLAPILAEGAGAWWAEVLARAEREGARWREVDPVWAVTHVLRVLVSLIREPGVITSAADVRAYALAFVVPCLLDRP